MAQAENDRIMSQEAVFKPSLPLLAVSGAENPSAPLLPLLLQMEGCATLEEMNSNVTATIDRGYTRINEYLSSCSGSVSIVGAGPSIKKTYTELTGDVLAVNSAIGFLLEKGIVPKWGMIWDASPLCEKFAVPHPEVTYLIGARCHPSVFERLKDSKVIAWHAGGDHNIAEFLKEKNIYEPMINGGSAGVTRAMYLACALGYRDYHIFGADSSYAENGDTHVNGSLVPEKDMQIWVGNGPLNRKFRTTPEWCAQIEEYKAIYPLFKYIGITMKVYGEGMLQHMHTLLEEKHKDMVISPMKFEKLEYIPVPGEEVKFTNVMEDANACE